MYRNRNSWQIHCFLIFILKISIVQTRKLILSGSFWAIAVCNLISIPYNKFIIISQGYHSRIQASLNCRAMASVWIQTGFLPHLPTLSVTDQIDFSTDVFRTGSRAVQKSCKASSPYKISFVQSGGEFERPSVLAWKELTAFRSRWILSLKHQL